MHGAKIEFYCFPKIKLLIGEMLFFNVEDQEFFYHVKEGRGCRGKKEGRGGSTVDSKGKFKDRGISRAGKGVFNIQSVAMFREIELSNTCSFG